VTGLPADFRASWRANNTGFPLGVDLLLASGDEFCAMTRTTLVED
jgi:alpha-D-ribose 1-methylphosphonate 5-triphosphate synthase subunit PhnH